MGRTPREEMTEAAQDDRCCRHLYLRRWLSNRTLSQLANAAGVLNQCAVRVDPWIVVDPLARISKSGTTSGS
jgi:hypothetical protein